MIEGTDKFYCVPGALLLTVQYLKGYVKNGDAVIIPENEAVLMLRAHSKPKRDRPKEFYLTMEVLWTDKVVTFHLEQERPTVEYSYGKIGPGLLNYFKLLRSPPGSSN